MDSGKPHQSAQENVQVHDNTRKKQQTSYTCERTSDMIMMFRELKQTTMEMITKTSADFKGINEHSRILFSRFLSCRQLKKQHEMTKFCLI